MIRLFFTLFFVFAFAAPSVIGQAWAQFGLNQEEEEETAPEVKILNPYDSKYRPNPSAASSGSTPNSPVPTSSYNIDITNAVTGREGDFKVTISTLGSVSGCVTTQAPTLSMRAKGKIMELEISKNVTTAETSQRRYMHYSCNLESNMELASFILNRDEFLNKGLNQIKIIEEDIGQVGLIEVEMNQHNALIKPRFPSFNEPFLDSDKDKNTIWFYPVGAIALFNPSLDFNDPDTYTKVSGLARSNGLTLIEDSNPAFQRLQQRSNKELLVIDANGTMNDKFEDPGAVITLGEVESLELFTGPNGDYNKAKQKPVFAALAGTR